MPLKCNHSVESFAGIHDMKAGKPISLDWATPAPGSKTEFEVGSARERFMSSSGLKIPSRALKAGNNVVSINSGTLTLNDKGETV